MSNEFDPIVDQWYLHRDKGETFRVIEADAETGLVEIQDFQGNVEELDMDEWRELEIELAAEPEDWTGPFDDVEPDGPGDTQSGGTITED